MGLILSLQILRQKKNADKLGVENTAITSGGVEVELSIIPKHMNVNLNYYSSAHN